MLILLQQHENIGDLIVEWTQNIKKAHLRMGTGEGCELRSYCAILVFIGLWCQTQIGLNRRIAFWEALF